MHLSFLHKYVIISITYLTPKPVRACLGSQSLRLCIREDGDRHRPKTQPPTPFPDDASNQATYTLYMKITTHSTTKNRPLHPICTVFTEIHDNTIEVEPQPSSMALLEEGGHSAEYPQKSKGKWCFVNPTEGRANFTVMPFRPYSAPKNWRIIGCISIACSFWICS